jgi:hypothetical protein
VEGSCEHGDGLAYSTHGAKMKEHMVFVGSLKERDH